MRLDEIDKICDCRMLSGVEFVYHSSLMEEYYGRQAYDSKICVKCGMFQGI